MVHAGAQCLALNKQFSRRSSGAASTRFSATSSVLKSKLPPGLQSTHVSPSFDPVAPQRPTVGTAEYAISATSVWYPKSVCCGLH
jgi:hypothetical protein